MRRYGRTRFEKYDTDGYIKAARARENLVAKEEIESGEYEHVAYLYEDPCDYIPEGCWNENCPQCYPKVPE
jgi:hypothetical protein